MKRYVDSKSFIVHTEFEGSVFSAWEDTGGVIVSYEYHPCDYPSATVCSYDNLQQFYENTEWHDWIKPGIKSKKLKALLKSEEPKITSARITPLPKDFLDPMPKVYITIEGKEEFLFEFYPDEISFAPQEFIGLTREEAHNLKFRKDKQYLQS